MNYHGKHVLCDFIFNIDDINDDEDSFGLYVMYSMEMAVNQTRMRIVHRCLKMLGDTDESEPGFTSVLLLDESHFTSHCYSKRGMLACDIFTCGDTDPQIVMDYFIRFLQKEYPSITCTYNKFNCRFHY
jgi:S-adenosylmethionine decarboxylase